MCITFLSGELSDTSAMIRAEISKRILRPRKPDILFGTHQLAVFGSLKQSIDIWHGSRIEKNFASWVAKISGWKSQHGVPVVVNGKRRVIDNLVSNASLNVVLAIESKRVWENQDGNSQNNVRQTAISYKANQSAIVAATGLSTAHFRYFVFNAYGGPQTGKKGLPPIITGDEICRIFGACVWNYMEWERAVIREAMFDVLNVLADRGDPAFVVSDDNFGCHPNAGELLEFIDRHAE